MPPKVAVCWKCAAGWTVPRREKFSAFVWIHLSDATKLRGPVVQRRITPWQAWAREKIVLYGNWVYCGRDLSQRVSPPPPSPSTRQSLHASSPPPPFWPHVLAVIKPEVKWTFVEILPSHSPPADHSVFNGKVSFFSKQTFPTTRLVYRIYTFLKMYS